MVAEKLASAGRLALRGISDDFAGFFCRTRGSKSPEIGLHTYRFNSADGNGRIHLRIENDGRGVLFVDVTDVIHLNPTAATMAKLSLDGIPYPVAHATLSCHVGRRDRQRMSQDLRDIYDLIERLGTTAGECPTCAVPALENAPLFSVPARAPYKVDLALTYGCNNACGHCYNEPDRFSMTSLTTGEWYQVLDKLHGLGVPHVIFTGGEATLHPDLPDLINYADSLGLIVGLNTNGRRIADRSYIELLAASGLNHVQVTLGSSRPEVHDAIMGAKSFSQTVQGIQNAISSAVHCITNTTLMRCNKDHALEIIDYIHELGIRTFAMNGMIYSGGGLFDPNAIPESGMPPILTLIRDRATDLDMRFLWYTPTEYCRMSPVELEIGAKRCNAAEYSLCIEPNGDVLPCQSYYVAAGNILRDPWTTIWYDDLFRSFRERGEDPRGSGLPEKCWDCPDLPLCGGGCRLEREARAGDGQSVNCSGSCAGNKRSDSTVVGGFAPSPGASNGAVRARGGSLGLIDIIDNPVGEAH